MTLNYDYGIMEIEWTACVIKKFYALEVKASLIATL